MAETKTETGIDISNYIAEKAKGLVDITKGKFGNYIFQRVKFTQGDPDPETGYPTMVPYDSDLTNINRASLASLESELVAREAVIAATRAQLAAIAADMDALDAA